MIDCNEWRTEKRHECANMGKVKRLELRWKLYRTSLPVWDLGNFRPMDFFWHECTSHCGITYAYYVSFEKFELERPLRRHGFRWDDRIKMELKEGEYDGLEWIHVAQYMEQRQRQSLGKRLMNLRTERVRVPPCFSQNPCGPLQVLLHILYTVFVIKSRLFTIIFRYHAVAILSPGISRAHNITRAQQLSHAHFWHVCIPADRLLKSCPP